MRSLFCRRLILQFCFIAILFYFFSVDLVLFSQAKKENPKKGLPPQILNFSPLSIPAAGQPIKVTVSGFRLEQATSATIADGRGKVRILGKSRKIKPPKDDLVPKFGDSEIDLEVTLSSMTVSKNLKLTLKSNAGESKPHELIVRGNEKYIMEKEPNQSFASAQTLTLPIIVEGKIQSAKDVDVFQFPAKKGETLLCKVEAQILGSPAELILYLHDRQGKLLQVARAQALAKDPEMKVVIPHDGIYYLSALDANDLGNNSCGYLLYLSLETQNSKKPSK